MHSCHVFVVGIVGGFPIIFQHDYESVFNHKLAYFRHISAFKYHPDTVGHSTPLTFSLQFAINEARSALVFQTAIYHHKDKHRETLAVWASSLMNGKSIVPTLQ